MKTKIWQLFTKKGPSGSQLIERATKIAAPLVEKVSDHAPELYESLRDASVDTSNDTLDPSGLPSAARNLYEDLRLFARDLSPEQAEFTVEELIFCLHLIKRFASSAMSHKKQALFSDGLLSEVIRVLSSSLGPGADASKFRVEFLSIYNIRSAKYAKYRKLIPEQGEGTRNTLLWEYGKQIMAKFFPDKNTSYIGVTLIGHTPLKILDSLRVDELFVP
jgi:hypothetical protein